MVHNSYFFVRTTNTKIVVVVDAQSYGSDVIYSLDI
jgi:hypothetical protein